MKIKVGQLEARLFGRAGESVTRSDRRERELEFESPFPPLTARPNRRRDGTRELTIQSSPLGGAPNQHETGGKTLTPVGHLFMTPTERRFAPTTVRQARNGVRYGLEQVSAFIGIRTSRLPLSLIERGSPKSQFTANKSRAFNILCACFMVYLSRSGPLRSLGLRP